MGMFDSFYGADNSEWQTKAFGRALARWGIGDAIPGPPIDYQAEVVGGRSMRDRGNWAYATIRAGRLASVGDSRDLSLPLCLYAGGWEASAEGDNDGHHEDR